MTDNEEFQDVSLEQPQVESESKNDDETNENGSTTNTENDEIENGDANQNTNEDASENNVTDENELPVLKKQSFSQVESRSNPLPATPVLERHKEENEEDSEEEEDQEHEHEKPNRLVAALENLKPDGDLRKPIEELIEQTLAENPIYDSREALLNEEDPHALIFWGKTISTHAKRMKAHFLRKRKQDKSDEESFQWSSNQIVMVYINFHSSAIDKFLLASTLDPTNSFIDINPTSLVSSSTKRKKGNLFPTMELCFEWGLASLRYGKALENQKDFHASYAQYDTAAKLFMRVIQEERRRKFSQKVIFIFLILVQFHIY